MLKKIKIWTTSLVLRITSGSGLELHLVVQRGTQEVLLIEPQSKVYKIIALISVLSPIPTLDKIILPC